MIKLPTIKLIDKTKLNEKILEDDEALLLLDSGVVKKLNEVCPTSNGCVNIIVPIKDPHLDLVTEENKAEAVCTLDIDVILDYVELCRGYKTLYISDMNNLEKSWAVALGISVYCQPKLGLKEIVYDVGSTFSGVRPAALQVVECFDLLLKKGGLLTEAVEEYLVTGKLIKVGKILSAPWAA